MRLLRRNWIDKLLIVVSFVLVICTLITWTYLLEKVNPDHNPEDIIMPLQPPVVDNLDGMNNLEPPNQDTNNERKRVEKENSAEKDKPVQIQDKPVEIPKKINNNQIPLPPAKYIIQKPNPPLDQDTNTRREIVKQVNSAEKYVSVKIFVQNISCSGKFHKNFVLYKNHFAFFIAKSFCKRRKNIHVMNHCHKMKKLCM